MEPKASATSVSSFGTCFIPRLVSLITGGIAKTTVAIMPGTFPSPKKMRAGIRYTKDGMVCMKSSEGFTTWKSTVFFAERIPSGIPIISASRVDESTRASVSIESSQSPILSIRKKPNAVPDASLMFRFPTKYESRKIPRIKSSGGRKRSASFKLETRKSSCLLVRSRNGPKLPSIQPTANSTASPTGSRRVSIFSPLSQVRCQILKALWQLLR